MSRIEEKIEKYLEEKMTSKSGRMKQDDITKDLIRKLSKKKMFGRDANSNHIYYNTTMDKYQVIVSNQKQVEAAKKAMKEVGLEEPEVSKSGQTIHLLADKD